MNTIKKMVKDKVVRFKYYRDGESRRLDENAHLRIRSRKNAANACLYCARGRLNNSDKVFHDQSPAIDANKNMPIAYT